MLPLNKFMKVNRYSKVFSFNKSYNLWTKDRIVNSPYKNVVLPESTISDYIWGNMQRWPTKVAVVCAATKRSYTYEELYKYSQSFGATLRKKFNIVDGDIVAIMLPNLPEYPIILLGILAAGGIVTTINPVYKSHEVQSQLSESKLVVVHPDAVTVVKQSLKTLKKDIPMICVDINSDLPNDTVSYKDIIDNKHVDLSILKDVKIAADNVALLPYSSGTTGLQKGVELTNRSVVSNFKQLDGECIQQRPTTDTYQDTVLLNVPMFHSYGLLYLLLHKMSAGLKIVILNKFQPDTFLKVLLDNELTMLYFVPPFVLFLGTHPDVTPKHFAHVHTVTCGGAPLPEANIHNFLDKVGNCNVQFTQSYGLTETSPMVTLGPQGFKDYISIGYALPNTQLRVIDQVSNNLGPGESGELLIKGPQVMKGYKNNPEANKQVFMENGWFRSGDIASIDDDGKVIITDRLKELIKVKAYQVAPAELESLLKQHSGIFDAAVVGVPDSLTGERPRAFVVLNKGIEANEKNIIDFVAERVAPYKIIKEVVFVDSIPKTSSGKILRRDLKEKYC